jgi:putative NADPH-quinone reductase
MSRRIAIIQGHPDPARNRLCHALGDAYAAGAGAAGHSVQRIEVASLQFPLLRTQADFESGTPPPDIAEAQGTISWSEHLVIIHPLWLGGMPALFAGFLEQTLRPGFTTRPGSNRLPQQLLEGRSVRIIVTMGMPAFVYRWYFRAHGLKTLERSILAFSGFGPIRHTLIGGVGSLDERKRERWLERMKLLGARAA